MRLMIGRLLGKLYRLIRIHHDPVAFARSLGVRVGDDCRFIGIGERTFGSEPYLITIGDHVTITSDVRFITHDGGVWVFRREHPAIDVVAPIQVGNNVFIGVGTIIMPGVSIGDNCVIAAGSIITANVPSDVVIGGVPARVIKSLSEYWDGVEGRALYIRHLSPKDKRDYLMRLVAGSNGG